MAIKLYGKTAVMHSHDVPGYKYRMDWGYNVPATVTASSMASWVNAIAKDPKKPIQSLVINCHGSPGHLHIGTGIGKLETATFAPLRSTGLMYIWIVACELAAKGAGIAPGGSDGAFFLSKLAQASGAKVIASDRTQWVNFPWVPRNHIDIYEGAVYTYDSDGQLYDVGRRKPNWMRLIKRSA